MELNNLTSMSLSAWSRFKQRDETLDALKGIASKGEQDIVSAVDAVKEMLRPLDWGDYVRHAIDDKKILPELVQILERNYGDDVNARVYRAAVDAIDVITHSQHGRHVQAVVEAGACTALLGIIQLPDDELVKKALGILVYVTEKEGPGVVFPEDYSLRSLINLAPKAYMICLTLINSLLRERTPPKDEVDKCVCFLDESIPRVTNYFFTRPYLLDSSRLLVKLLNENRNYLDEAVVHQLRNVHKRLRERTE